MNNMMVLMNDGTDDGIMEGTNSMNENSMIAEEQEQPFESAKMNENFSMMVSEYDMQQAEFESQENVF